jgi:sarcosine oxidase
MTNGKEVVVVGAGVIGLSATLALADRGVDVTCVEQARPGAGQSGGQVRNFRHYHNSLEMIERARQAHRGWTQWEERFGTSLLKQVGLITIGDRSRNIADMLQQCQVPVTFTQIAGSIDRLPTRRSWDTPLVLDDTAGPIAADHTLQTLYRALADRVIHATVLALQAYSDRVDVATSHGILSADQVLLCAGPQTDRIALSVGVQIDIVRALHARPCYAIKSAPGREHSSYVSVIDASNLFGPSVYGGPTPDRSHYVMGLNGVSDDTPICTHDSQYGVDVAAVTADIARVNEYVAAAFTDLDPNPVSARLCTTTALAGEDGDAMACYKRDRLSFLVGNNLFKFAPLLGPALADVVTGKGSDWLVRVV